MNKEVGGIMYIIYKITNVINNKIYIGMTHKSLNKRWQEHCNSALSNNDSCVFHKAIKKYGGEAFQKEILECNLTQEEAKEKEIYYISILGSYYLDGHGYNMTYGGQCNDHLKGEKSYSAKLTDQEARIIRKLLKDRNLSYGDILLKINKPNTENMRHLISGINKGLTYFCENENYPIREDSRKMEYYSKLRSGDKNPMSKISKEIALKIIEDLQKSKDSQTKLAQKYNLSYNTINLINRCKIWNDLHHFKNNIRKESGNINHEFSKRTNTDEKILSVIYLLEQTQLSYKEIAKKTKTSISSINQINSCKIGKNLHNYHSNIRKEKK